MPVEAERALRAERFGNEVPGVERLQRVVHDDLLARPAAAPAGHDRVDRVEDFTHGYGGQPDSVRPSIGSGVEDHQVLPGREHGVEQQLPVLGTWVALTDARVAAENVVAIDAGAARELAVVQAEQADHAVRHRTHRHHGAHSQVPGPEVRPGGSARQPLGEQGMDVGERPLADWLDTLTTALERLTAVRAVDAWQSASGRSPTIRSSISVSRSTTW